MPSVTCICGTVFQARAADIRRGWGKFCSKSCKAKKQTKDTDIAGPHYKAAGKTVKQMKAGQYAKSKHTGGAPKNGIFRDGQRVVCAHCGNWATNGVESILSDTPIDPIRGFRIEWTCDDHFDDTHPFSEFNNT